MIEKCNLDELDMMSFITAAACHDFDHPGVNNAYHMATRDDIHVLYIDQAVLENHHIASSFQLISGKCDFLANCDRAAYNRIRSTMISAVLSTDMARHFAELGKFKSKVSMADFKPQEGADKRLVTEMIFHVSDISNPSKPWHICQYWTDLLFVEFFMQGDMERERGLPISQFMDRHTTNIAKTQLGFIDFIVSPVFQACQQFLPKMQRNFE